MTAANPALNKGYRGILPNSVLTSLCWWPDQPTSVVPITGYIVYSSWCQDLPSLKSTVIAKAPERGLLEDNFSFGISIFSMCYDAVDGRNPPPGIYDTLKIVRQINYGPDFFRQPYPLSGWTPWCYKRPMTSTEFSWILTWLQVEKRREPRQWWA